MPDDCALSMDKLQNVPKRALKGRITTINGARLDEVCDALRYALGC